MLLAPEDQYIIVNYHYVQDPRPDFSGIFPCGVKEFERQIALLTCHFTIKTLGEVFEACRSSAPGKFAAITFDDGLKGQYYNALPVLKKYGVTATFFIITSTLNGTVPSAHKIHVFLSRASPDWLIDAFNDFIRAYYPDDASRFFIPKDRRVSERRQHEDVKIANFKETLSAIPVDIKNKFMESAFSTIGLKESELARELFMIPAEIASLHQAGFEIGNHTDSHDAINTLGMDRLRTELRQSQEKLKSITGRAPAVFSYPFGLANTLAFQALEEEKFKYAVTIETRALALGDHKFMLPRFDTNDVRDGAVV